MPITQKTSSIHQTFKKISYPCLQQSQQKSFMRKISSSKHIEANLHTGRFESHKCSLTFPCYDGRVNCLDELWPSSILYPFSYEGSTQHELSIDFAANVRGRQEGLLQYLHALPDAIHCEEYWHAGSNFPPPFPVLPIHRQPQAYHQAC